MKSFVEEVGRTLKIERTDLVEKDVLIHSILSSLSDNDYFSNNLIFKGGTCLIKTYLGYYRFSEDMDFTWLDQSAFEGLSQKNIRQQLSEKISEIGDILAGIGKEMELDFTCDKSDKRYVELGGSNKTATFKIWYDSKIVKRTTFIKVQINFVEHLAYPPVDNTLKSLVSDLPDKETGRFFPEEYPVYSRGIRFKTYDLREILCEKARSILTRRGIKARDFVDLYLIKEKYGLDIAEFKPEIIAKMKFSLKLYEKYRNNMDVKKDLVYSKSLFSWGSEKDLLLADIDGIKFSRFVEDLSLFFVDIVEELEEIKI